MWMFRCQGTFLLTFFRREKGIELIQEAAGIGLKKEGVVVCSLLPWYLICLICPLFASLCLGRNGYWIVFGCRFVWLVFEYMFELSSNVCLNWLWGCLNCLETAWCWLQVSVWSWLWGCLDCLENVWCWLRVSVWSWLWMCIWCWPCVCLTLSSRTWLCRGIGLVFVFVCVWLNWMNLRAWRALNHCPWCIAFIPPPLINEIM